MIKQCQPIKPWPSISPAIDQALPLINHAIDQALPLMNHVAAIHAPPTLVLPTDGTHARTRVSAACCGWAAGRLDHADRYVRGSPDALSNDGRTPRSWAVARRGVIGGRRCV